ncbi:MAG: nucleoside hydrolase [Parasporobacterium sp.]|nr:nucleoside hydrolase [Parasporobacterium sp.]
MNDKKIIDVVLDTDAYNEIDDQFAVSFLLRSSDRLNTRAIYAAPFFNERSEGPKDGMEKSYQEILKLLKLLKCEEMSQNVFRGSERYLPDEKTPVVSPAAIDLAERAMQYSAENPLTVAAIGAITNVASAILLKPEITERIKVVWLGGNSRSFPDTREFNMFQDIAAARVVMRETDFVQLPCNGVVSEFRISGPELEFWLCGKNSLADYLAGNVIREAESYASGTAWTRVIWDVTAVAWLLNDDDRYMKAKILPALLPDYTGHYETEPLKKTITYVYRIHRDRLMTDLLRSIARDGFLPSKCGS